MEPTMKRLEELGRHIREEHSALEERSADLGRIRVALMQTATTPGMPHPSRRRGVAAVAVVGLAVTAAAIWAVRSRSAPPLAYRVVGDTSTTTWIAAPPEEPLEVVFSDGSRVVMAPRARGRLASVHPTGANIVMESGRAEFDFVPKSGGRWQVFVGPYTLRVTGTRFDVDWEPKVERIELVLREGSVVVSGCGPERSVHAGDRLVASCRNRGAEITQGAPPQDAAGPEVDPLRPPPAPSGASPMDAPPADSVAGQLPASERPGERWRELAKRGRYKEAFAAAEAEGFEAACSGSSASELLSLGSSARFSGRAEKAAFAYDALRRRFPGDSRAALAAFELARLAFDVRGDYSAAAKWFRTYLREQPGGALAREAQGRLFEALQRSGDASGARAEALRYLEAHPSGPHREAARSLVGPEPGVDAGRGR